MKYSEEQLLIAARPAKHTGNPAFVARTMQAVKAANTQAATARVLAKTKEKQSFTFLGRLTTLPTAAVVALIIVSIIALGGATYAAVRFAPSLIKIFSKETSPRGTIEYSVPSFEECVNDEYAFQVSKFELNKDAPRLNDDDVEKILQAQCELSWVDGFVSSTWPTYGSQQEWQEGDDIFYARPDIMGTLKSVSPTTATIDTGGPHMVDFTAPKGEEIVAYANGQKVALGRVAPGDTVFAIVRVAEKYPVKWPPQDYEKDPPRPQGIIALLVLSLPAKYYGSMQQYLTPIRECMGNPGESCPGAGYIDIFPREGGEGATNQAFKESSDSVQREISGSVIKFSASTLTLKTRTGKEYTVTTPASDFTAYNSKYASNYTDMDATLKVGSTVMVMYAQAPGSDPQTIAPSQIRKIALLIDSSNPKMGDIKPY